MKNMTKETKTRKPIDVTEDLSGEKVMEMLHIAAKKEIREEDDFRVRRPYWESNNQLVVEYGGRTFYVCLEEFVR